MPTRSRANHSPARHDSDAMVLGAFALPQDHRRSRARPRVRNATGAAAAGGSGVRLTAANIDAHIARAGTGLQGLGRRQFRSGLADRAAGANLDNAQPPGRGDLLVAETSRMCFRALRAGCGGLR